MYTYAKINKETLKFIRETKQLSFEYIERITKFPEEKILLWEDDSSQKYPTINQAKIIAKCYRVPFAGLYMNSYDIDIKHLPPLRNLRTLPEPIIDNSAINLAIIDVLSARDLLMESQNIIEISAQPFSLHITIPDDTERWASIIRTSIGLKTDYQYKLSSSRKLYLHLRDLVEKKGVFVHGFDGVDSNIVRGFAIYEDYLPVIGINNNDRPPAKSFTIIHELVHLMKRSSTICNDMNNSFCQKTEEIFCNAVAGEVLVPKANLISQLGSYTSDEIDLNIIKSLANKFSVSKEVICRRLLDINRISKNKYVHLIDTIQAQFKQEREATKEQISLTGKGIPRNIPREVIDHNSTTLCKTLYAGFDTGYFDKQDIARYFGVKHKHIDTILSAVSRW